jgi:hypothetical protein
MKNLIEIFGQDFVLTGDNTDPRDLNLAFLTHVKVSYNQDGTEAAREYYMTYDPGTGEFSDLAIRSVFNYFYDGFVLTSRTEDVEWYFTDGQPGATRQLTEVYIQAKP